MTSRGWVEPAARLPLRWGGHRDRVAAGLLLIVTGLVHLLGASTHNLSPLLIGSVAHTIGWLILPAAGWRRLLPVMPSGLVAWLLLSGPQAMWALVVPYAGWLIARHRPARSYLTLAPVLLYGAVAIAVFGEYDQQLGALAASGAVLASSAWWAWALARPVSASAAPATASA